MTVRLDNMAELRPTTIAIAATEPVFGSGLSEQEKRYFIDELEQTLGKEVANQLLHEAEEFHKRVHNHPVFQGLHTLLGHKEVHATDVPHIGQE